jgi:hypothetical protein
LGTSNASSAFSLSIGTEMSLFIGKNLYGLGGVSIMSPVVTNARGQASYNIGGVYGKYGHLLYRFPTSIVYGYAGIGIMQNTLSVTNASDSYSLAFTNEEGLKPGEKKNYISNGAMLDLGVSYKTIIMGIHDSEDDETLMGGAWLGIEAGCMVFSDKQRNLDGLLGRSSSNNHFHFSPYIKLTIGPGGIRKR